MVSFAGEEPDCIGFIVHNIDGEPIEPIKDIEQLDDDTMAFVRKAEEGARQCIGKVELPCAFYVRQKGVDWTIRPLDDEELLNAPNLIQEGMSMLTGNQFLVIIVIPQSTIVLSMEVELCQ